MRARYRRRRRLAVLVLASLFFGIGTQAAALFKAEAPGSAGAAEIPESPGFVPATFEGLLAQGDSNAIPADELRAPSYKTKKDLAASRSREPTSETKDQSPPSTFTMATRHSASIAEKTSSAGN